MDTEDGIMLFLCFLLMMCLVMAGIAASDADKNVGKVYPPKQYDCRVVPESKRDLVAKLIVDCVNNATAKTTGENQDADDWVKACKEKITEIYEVDGSRMGAVNRGGFDHYLTQCKELPDSLLTTAK